MRNRILKTGLLILLPLFLSAQVKIEETKGESYEIHKYNKFGLKSVIPNKSIEKQSDGSYKVYNYNNKFGIKNFTPSQKIEKTEDGYEVYNYNKFNLRSITPKYRIETKKGKNLTRKDILGNNKK